MSSNEKNNLDTISNIHEKLILPLNFYPGDNSGFSDSLCDFQIGFTNLINYIGEVLFLLSNIHNIEISSGYHSVDVFYEVLNKKKRILCPKLNIDTEKNDEMFSDTTNYLFKHSITQLASEYEIFLTSLLKEILRRNETLLDINEKQLSTKKIFELGSIKKIRSFLIQKKSIEFAMLSYPKKVDYFQSQFHIGIHSKKSPFTLSEVHDFIEVRNIIIHNDGHANEQYFERLKDYNQETLVKRTHFSLKPDFVWFISFAKQLLALGYFIENDISKKWKTTRNS